MSFPRYPKYKDSGVEWLGQVPEHWGVKRARALGVFSSSGIDKKSLEGEQAVQMFNYLDVYKSTVKILRYSPELMWTTAPSEKVAEHAVKTGDILLTPSSETADDIGHAARVINVPPNVVYSYHLLRFRPFGKNDSAFLTYCFNAPSIRSYFESVCTGTTRMVLVREDFKNAPFACPPPDEQARIAEFLDQETAKIDALVAEQERLMALLKEKRQAVISHAVTKGLNPKVAMKPSGIEWLGDVPAHWVVMSLRRCCSSVQTGGTPSDEPPSTDLEQGMVWYTPGDFGDSLYLTTSTRKISTKAVASGEAKIFPPNSVLIVSIGATLGKIGFAVEPSSANQQINAVIPNAKVDGYFLAYSLLVKTEVMRFLSNASTIGIMNQEKTKDIWLAVPPNKEQCEISAYLDKETAKLDTLTAEAQRAINLLEERRTALISAAVTGQIDVRKT